MLFRSYQIYKDIKQANALNEIAKVDADKAEKNLEEAKQRKNEAREKAIAAGKETFEFTGKDGVTRVFSVANPAKLAEPAGTIGNVAAPAPATPAPAAVSSTAPMAAPAKAPEPETIKGTAPLAKTAVVPETKEVVVKPATTTITPDTNPTTSVTKLPEAPAQNKITSEISPELTQRLDSLITLLSREKTKESSLNNMSNNSSSTTIVNNTTMGGEDNITSMRLKVFQYINNRRQLP